MSVVLGRVIFVGILTTHTRFTAYRTTSGLACIMCNMVPWSENYFESVSVHEIVHAYKYVVAVFKLYTVWLPLEAKFI